MEKIPFVKMNGCGNDFIIVDNRDDVMKSVPLDQFVPKICARRVSVGADGFMMVENSNIADFKMRYFNADGSEGEMCGNGARCLAKFAYIIGAAKEQMNFETLAGIYEAQILEGGSRVKVKFPSIDINSIKLNQLANFDGSEKTYHYAPVGVPHVVLFEEDLLKLTHETIVAKGRSIRYAQDLFASGTNVNFVKITGEDSVAMRTYERGVENETLACGTGSTATAVVSSLLGLTRSPVHVHNQAGILTIYFKVGKNTINEIYMEGEVKLVAEGYLLPDAWA